MIKAVIDSHQESDRQNKIGTNGDEKSVIMFSGNGGGISHREDVSFFNSHVYTLDGKGDFVLQRRVHFLSENSVEITTYAANVLIKCFHVSCTFILFPPVLNIIFTIIYKI